jgi:DNA-binding PadR family transcriptional regulator
MKAPKTPLLGYALLGLIHLKPQSGYELRKTFTDTAMGNYSDSPGAIYPALKRLERDGDVTSEVQEAGGLRRRRVFRISKPGMSKLKAWLREPVAPEDVRRGAAAVHRTTRVFPGSKFRRHALVCPACAGERYPGKSRDARVVGIRAEEFSGARCQESPNQLIGGPIMIAARNILRFVLTWIALIVAQVVAGMFIHFRGPQVPNVLPWMMVSDAIIAFCIAAVASRSNWRGGKLGLALYFIVAAIITVNTIEGAVFLPNIPLDWGRLLIYSLVFYAIAALLWMLIYRRAPVPESADEQPIPHRPFSQMAWRFALCAIAYFALYFIAGTIVFPFVREYYADKHLPTFGNLLAMQVFMRGPVFVLVCLVIFRMLRLPRMTGALGTGLLFTLLSGVATLIVPNGVFPDSVRWAHFCEVTSSNFVFGFVVAWVWGQAHRVRQLSPAHA